MTKIPAFLIRKPWAAAALSFAACLTHYFTSVPVYETAALVQWQAAETEPDFTAEDSDEIPDAVLSLAMEALDGQRTKAGQALLDVDEVADHLRISAGEQQGFLRLRFHSAERDDAESILSAVAAAYVETSRALKSPEALPKIEQYQRDQQHAQQEVNDNGQQVSQLEQELADEAFSDSSQQLLLERLKAFSMQLAQVKSDRLKAETRYREADRKLENGTAVNLVVAQLSSGSAKEIVQAVMSHADLVEALQHVRETRHDLLRFYGAKHPRIIEITARETELNRQISKAEENNTGIQQVTGFLPAETNRRSLLLKSLASDLRSLQELEVELQEQLDLEQSTLDRQTKLQGQIVQAEHQVSTAKAQLQQITTRLNSLKTGHRARAEIVEPAVTAADPVAPSLLSHLFWGGLAALIAALLSHWTFRELAVQTPAFRPVSSAEPERGRQAPLYARRLMRLARFKRNQDVP